MSSEAHYNWGMPPTPTDLVARLDAKNRELIRQLEASEFFRRFFSPETKNAMIEAMTAGLLHQVASYGHQLTRSITTALGRLAAYPEFAGKVPELMKSLLEEVTHAEIARKDSVNLRPASDLEAEKPSPAAFAVAAVARLLCEERHPLTHLGFFYLLEGTTSQIAPRLQKVLTARRDQESILETARGRGCEPCQRGRSANPRNREARPQCCG